MSTWVQYSIFGAIALAAQMLLLTKLTKMGFSTSGINAVVFSVASIGFIMYHVFSKQTLFIETSTSWSMMHYVALFMAALAIYLVNFFTIKALGLAPNPGYVNAIQNISTVIVTILGVFLLGSELSVIKSIGILFVLVGVGLISF